MKEFKYLHRKPTNIISNGSKKDYKRPVSPIFVLEGYSIVAAITNGTLTGAGRIIEGGTAEVTIVPNSNCDFPLTVHVTGASYEYNASTGVISLSNPTGDVTIAAECVSSTLSNNSWETIRAVCETGDAANYWSVGDTKSVTGGDGNARNVAIVDMSGMYGKNVVFQFRDLTENVYVWNVGNSNIYATCEITPKLAPNGDAFVELMDSALGGLLTDTSFKVATSGEDSTLITDTQKLFLPAEKEVTGTRVYSVQEEFDALSTFSLYSGSGDTNANRILKTAVGQTARGWWERSPGSGYRAGACNVYPNGGLNRDITMSEVRLAPCFAF